MSKYDESILSDLHKDAFGFRPSEGYFARWDASSESQKQQIWDDLIVALDQEIEVEKASVAAAITAWRSDIARNIAIGAQSRNKAILWDAQAYGINPRDPQGAESYCYERGIPFSYERQVERALRAR